MKYEDKQESINYTPFKMQVTKTAWKHNTMLDLRGKYFKVVITD